MIPALGKHSLRILAAQHVGDLLADMRMTGLSRRTRQYVHATLRTALKTAMRNDLVERNVAALVSAPRADKRRLTPLSNDDTHRLLMACASDRDGPLWALMVTMGLRIGEALALAWEDVDLDGGWLWPRYSVNRVTGAGHEFKPTKGNEHDSIGAVTPLAIPTGTVAFLRRQREYVDYLKLMTGDLWTDPQRRALIFPGAHNLCTDLGEQAGAGVGALRPRRPLGQPLEVAGPQLSLVQEAVPVNLLCKPVQSQRLQADLGRQPAQLLAANGVLRLRIAVRFAVLLLTRSVYRVSGPGL